MLLAAGAGRRMGRPKALVVGDDGEPWLVRGVRVLREGGCADVVVVLGAEAARARALLAASTPSRSSGAGTGTDARSGNPADAPSSSDTPTAPTPPDQADPPTASDPPDSSPPPGDIRIVEVADWLEGIGASLRAGLADVRNAGEASTAARFAVVTLVDLPELRPEAIRRLATGATETSLRQAFYAGRPGHPVVIGAAHLDALRATLHGDVGARPYLRANGAEAVDCTDLGGGDDVDAPPLRAG
ncbi:molybdenum cofactor cytidylyltransferase [Herbiconiux ginsengi]|uniref:Molybdenum cofactor cytidylyltransferase n=1 Tax=Herbiconiux ginsengi TaxID=381665 RepID=A0A1H3S9L9_9MICO|nr:molybdenum cofactor cytidylyltransferase [Herbiconiux ginsengi]